MHVSLSKGDIERLQATMTVCLTPLEYASAETWARELMSRVRALVGADQSFLAIPRPAEPNWHVVQDDDGAAAARDYLANFVTLDVALHCRRTELGVEVYHRDLLHRPEELRSDTLMNEWCRPHKLFDTAGIGFTLPNSASVLPALLHVYRDHETRNGMGERALLLLHLMLPAFKAAVHAIRDHWHRSADLARVLDTLDDGIAIFDASRRTLHGNSSLIRLLDGESPDGQRMLKRRTRDLAAALLSGCDIGRGGALRPAAVQEVATSCRRYRLSGTVLRGSSLSTRPVAVIDVVPVHPRPRSDAELRTTFELTSREIAVARLLAAGASGASVAQTLGIARSTARHHTEAVMRKLEIRSRAGVRERLLRP